MSNSLAHIFISYAREDEDIAKSIYSYLKSHDYSPWLDIKNLLPGQDWKTEIDKAIRDSQIFLACLSNKSVSKRGYVQAELKKALDILETIPEGDVYIIPVRLEDCIVPSQLARLHWLDYYKPQGKQNLLRAIKQYFNKTNESRNITPELTKIEDAAKNKYKTINIFLTFGDDAEKEGLIAEQVIANVDRICRSALHIQTRILNWVDLLPLNPPKTDQEFRNGVLEELEKKCDVFVLVLNRRYGSFGSNKKSDIEQQVEMALHSIEMKRNVIFLSYYHVLPTNIDPGFQEIEILNLQRRLRSMGLFCYTYKSVDEFQQTFFQNLYDEILMSQNK